MMESTSSENMTRSDLKALIIDAQLAGSEVKANRITDWVNIICDDYTYVSIGLFDYEQVYTPLTLEEVFRLIDRARLYRHGGSIVHQVFNKEDDGD